MASKNLGNHKRGDTFFGHLWVIEEDGDPRDISGDDFFLDFRTTAAAVDPAAWSLSSTVDPGGLNKIDGDGREITLPNGDTRVLEPLGFPYIVEMAAAIPPLDPGTFVWDIEHQRAGGTVITLEEGKLTIVQDVTRP